jgi:vitamin B12 transporter
LNSVTSNNYARNISRNNTSVTWSAKRETGERLGTTILLREILDSKKFLLPDFSAGSEYRLIAGEDYFIYSNFSRNSRIASLNDLYWSPGGNPSLKNEIACSYELGYRMTSEASTPVSLSADISLFGSHIHDMIIWQPGEYSYWTAENLRSVNVSGAESFAELRYSGNGFDLRLNAGYTYTRSVNANAENQANGIIQFEYGNFYSLWVSDFTGRRYISVDNSDFLPGYTINNIVTGIKINLNHLSADVNFRIDNLFNVNYQSMAFYPQPGRSYFIRLKFQYGN